MRKTYALFDFDGTLIGGDSILLFIRYARRKKLCKAADMLRFAAAGSLFMLGLISPQRAKEMGLQFLKGLRREQYLAVAEDFCRTVLVPRLYPQGIAAIRRHRQAGHDVLLVSASPAFYLNPLKDILGLTAVLGTQFSQGEDGCFAGTMLGPNCRGDQKPLRLQAYLDETGDQLDFATSFAYGDSAHDLPMLRLCAHACAVNPKPKLRRQLHTLTNVTVLTWKEKP